MAKRALIAGYYGAGNAGDEAILEAMLGSLREGVPYLVPVVVSEDPASTSLAYDVESISMRDRQAVMAAVRACDFVILGGGGLLNDYWDVSLGSFFSPTGAALSYSSYAALAALYSKPLILYAIGVGPLSMRTGRLYTQMMVEQAQLITVRDQQSKALLEELGIDGARIHVFADPAFLLPLAPPTLDLPRPILGAALRHWSIGIDPEAWEAEVAKALDGFVARHGGSVLFLPFQRSAIENNHDAATAERLRSRMRMGKSAVVFEGTGAPQQLAGAIGRCDLMLGMRYHSVLFALRQAIPTVGLVYDPKVRNLLASANCEECALDLGGIREDNLLEHLERAFAGDDGRAELTSFSHQMSAAASENCRQVAALLSGELWERPASATCRFWLDEFSAAAAFKDEGDVLKSAIHSRRNSLQRERSEPWPYDVVCCPGIEWDYRWMRAQQLMSQFAERGHRVFFVSVAAFLPAGGPKFVTRLLRRNVWEVQLATPEPVDVNSGLMPDAVRNALVDDLSAVAAEFAIERAACILHLSTWNPAAQRLRFLLGWLLVYDCIDDWSGFPFLPQALLDKETALVGDSDVVIVSAQKLWDKWSPRNHNTVLVRNAADPAHFQVEAPVEVPVEIPRSCPVIGFFGLIDGWFDVELVRRAARERPQYLFILIGAVYDKRAEELRNLANVQVLGHQPYDLLPAYLRRFDACIIPFKINALTQATDPVKFYEYIVQGKPVVSTRLPELEAYREVAYLAEGPEDFVRMLDTAVDERDPELVERRMALARENSWSARYEVFDSAMEQTFAAQTHPRILFAYHGLSLGGVEIALQSRVGELRRRGWFICLVFIEEIDGRILFEDSGIDVRICPGEAELARVLADFKPNWIVSIDMPMILPIARAISPEAQLVYEVHSSYPHILAPLADRALLTWVRGVIVPSASQRQRVRSLMAADKGVEVVPNALSPKFFDGNDTLEAPSRPVVLWVGRLDSLKGWRRFVEIASRLRDRTDSEFLMVSAGFSGEEGDELADLIESGGLGSRFRRMQAVEHSRMPALYRVAAQSGGCLVSTSASESFGMAVLEAMACGCPVVVPDVVGLRDLVRHAETGRLYPPGELAAACEEVIETLSQNPEQRRIVTDNARKFARRFGPEPAVDRFLAVLAEWPAPGDDGAERQPDLAPVRKSLERILATAPQNTTIVIFPPSMPWTSAALSNTARQWARSFAHCGCLVFYSDSQHLAAGENTFTKVENRIFAANAPLEVYAGIKAPIVVANSSNLDQLRHFRDPLVLYECAEQVSENESDLMTLCAEWLARATLVTVSSEKLYESILSQRPDAVLMSKAQLSQDDFVSAILDRFKSTRTGENDPARLRAMLAWRERQVHTLERQIRDRDRPAVEILHDAVTELKRVLAERTNGIAFLRSEVAARDKIVNERGQAVEFLKTEVAQREAAMTFLRNEIESRDEVIRERHRAIEFLQQEVTGQKASITLLREEEEQRGRVISERDHAIEALQGQTAEQSRSIAFLSGELTQREGLVSERDKAIDGLQQQLTAESATITFLREQLASQEKTVSEREDAIESLRQQITAQSASMAFLGQEVAHREGVISEQKIAIESFRKEIAAQSASVAFLQEELALREKFILDRETGIEFLRQEGAARDLAATAHLEGITFLRAEVAHRDRIIEDLESQLAGLREIMEELRESDQSRILHGESSAG